VTVSKRPRRFSLLGRTMTPVAEQQGQLWPMSERRRCAWRSNPDAVPILNVCQRQDRSWVAWATWSKGMSTDTLTRKSKAAAVRALKNQVDDVLGDLMTLDFGGQRVTLIRCGK
jgi:hypothetical protein